MNKEFIKVIVVFAKKKLIKVNAKSTVIRRIIACNYKETVTAFNTFQCCKDSNSKVLSKRVAQRQPTVSVIYSRVSGRP